MRTIAEFARKMGVSPQTVYRHASRLEGGGGEEAVVFLDGRLCVTEAGEKILAERIGPGGEPGPVKPKVPDVKQKVPDENDRGVKPKVPDVKQKVPDVKQKVPDESQPPDPLADLWDREEAIWLREENRTLREELVREREHSRAQADRLADLAERLARIAQNSQALLGAERGLGAPPLLAAETAPDPRKKSRFAGWVEKLFMRADG